MNVDLDNKYVVVPANKASKKTVFVWKTYCYGFLVTELCTSKNGTLASSYAKIPVFTQNIY